MNHFDFPKARSIVVVGDIHGDFNKLIFKCCLRYKMTDALIIVAGDCGFGFERSGYYEHVYERNRKRLSAANCWVVMLRGNHDNPAYFEEPYRIRHERFMTVPDYSVLEACGRVMLCVGGAISLDRMIRMNSRYYHENDGGHPLERNVYWPDEAPVFDRVRLDEITETYEVDAVITHTAPAVCDRIVKQGLYSLSLDDDRLLGDVEAEREVMDAIRLYLLEHHHPVRDWCYAHFHQSWHYEIDGVLYNMLDVMEFREVFITMRQ